MRIKSRRTVVCMLLSVVMATHAQDWLENDDAGKLQPLSGLGYKVESQGSFSRGKTPLWLNANKHGLSSLSTENGYVRAAVERPLRTDSARRWAVGYGFDVAVPVNYTSDIVVQQAYAELRWLYGVLTVGSKERRMELKNNALSSGSQTLGINARPVPQVRIELADYWVPPFLNGWLRLKGHIAYGKMTDDGWQHEFTKRKSRYADDVYYHSKAGYIKIGNEDKFLPWSLELGLETGSMFGGTVYRPKVDGTMEVIKGEGLLKGMWHTFVLNGSDAGESLYENGAGSHVGSWLVRLNYDADRWRLGIYADKFFEDHSAMIMIDYDGYGKNEQWNKKKKSRFILYDLKDIMLGAEINLKQGTWLRDIVMEYVYTKYQSGPIFHDHTQGIADHIGGIDNYYNHYVYTGWQHWGQVIGNPLYRSPIYNDDGMIEVKNSRFMALHLGFDGRPVEALTYRVLATWQEGLGTYVKPYTGRRYNFSFMVEAAYRFSRNWRLSGAYAMDFGRILGNNRGFQITLSKSGLL